jgi:hypothetical protein
MRRNTDVSAPIESDIQVERWPIDRLVFYERNPHKNDSFEVISAGREKGAV